MLVRRRRYGYDVLRVICAGAVCLYHFECTMVPLIGGGRCQASQRA